MQIPGCCNDQRKAILILDRIMVIDRQNPAQSTCLNQEDGFKIMAVKISLVLANVAT